MSLECRNGQRAWVTCRKTTRSALDHVTKNKGHLRAWPLRVGVPPELQVNSIAGIVVTFEPAAGDLGAQTGKLTITATAPYGPVSLTVELTGTGVQPS
jgi:hypothetical protein